MAQGSVGGFGARARMPTGGSAGYRVNINAEGGARMPTGGNAGYRVNINAKGGRMDVGGR